MSKGNWAYLHHAERAIIRELCMAFRSPRFDYTFKNVSRRPPVKPPTMQRAVNTVKAGKSLASLKLEMGNQYVQVKREGSHSPDQQGSRAAIYTIVKNRKMTSETA
jgi:hypothetical protein